MIEHIGGLWVRLTARWLPGPRGLVVRAWAWLCTNTDDLDEKQRRLEATL